MFSDAEWGKIRNELKRDPLKYGLPERHYGSVLIASFNIRKLGKSSASGRDEATLQFLADVCRRFDLVAVQEVMPELDGIRELRDKMGERYGLAVSDIVGTFPGEQGSEERLAFIYNPALVRRAELVTSVSTSRTKILKTLARYHQELYDAFESDLSSKAQRKFYLENMPEYLRRLAAGEDLRRPREPAFSPKIDHFLQFIRQPFAVAFQVHGHPGLGTYDFLAVNAHLHYGRMQDRKAEARALFEWIIHKVQSSESSNVVIMGDLNFDYDNPEKDLQEVLSEFAVIERESRRRKKLYVSFPFIFPHPNPPPMHTAGEVYRTNIRLNQTYDQIGVFSQDKRVGAFLETTSTGHGPRTHWGADGMPDYGVFNFSNLFSVALLGKPLDELGKAQRTAFCKRFEHKVSDHLPIWYRIPLPTAQQKFPSAI